MNYFDLRIPFFIPLWRRVLTLAITFGWAGVEFSRDETGWAIMFALLGLYATYSFFVKFDPEEIREKDFK